MSGNKTLLSEYPDEFHGFSCHVMAAQMSLAIRGIDNGTTHANPVQSAPFFQPSIIHVECRPDFYYLHGAGRLHANAASLEFARYYVTRYIRLTSKESNDRHHARSTSAYPHQPLLRNRRHPRCAGRIPTSHRSLPVRLESAARTQNPLGSSNLDTRRCW